MALQMDPEVAAAMAPLAEAAAGITPPPPGDWQTRRAAVDGMISGLTGSWTTPADVEVIDLEATAEDGAAVPLRLYRKAGSSPGSLAVYLHGGGMFLCSVDTHDPICRRYAGESGVPSSRSTFASRPSIRTRHRSKTATPRCGGPPTTLRTSG